VFVRFLKLIGTAVPDGLELHLIRDNYAPQDPGDQEVAAGPRFHLHFTPDQLVADQPRRAVVRAADQPQAPPVRCGR
jgi:hypothetical protein